MFRSLRVGLLILLLAFALPSAAPAQDELTADSVRQRVAEAVNLDRLRDSKAWMLEGAAEVMGVDTGYNLVFFEDGAFRERIEGRISYSSAWTGERGWQTDPGGTLSPLELRGLDSSRLASWVTTNLWLLDDNPVRARLDSSDAASVKLRLRIPGRPLRATLTVDRSDWLPETLVIGDGRRESTVTLDRYREFSGVYFPAETTVRHPGGEQHYRLDRAEPISPDRELLRPPAYSDGGISFDSEADAALETEHFPSGHILVRTSINGEDAGWFVFDSGAGITAVDRELAGQIGLDTFGELNILGAGGSEPARLAWLETLTVGPATLERPLVRVLDLSQVSELFGREIGGIVGFDLLARTVTEVSTGDGSLAIYDPQTYTPSGEVTWSDVRFSNQHPAVYAEFEGDRRGLFRIDIGAGSGVIFHEEAVSEHQLLQNRDTREVSGEEFGGEVTMHVGRIDWLELAGRRFEDVGAGFAGDEHTVFNDPYLAGNIGNQVLSAFKLVFDYPNRRLGFISRTGEDSSEES